MTYTITAGKSFNMVLSHKDTRDPSSWSKMSKAEIMSEMMDQFRGWDPR
jgi:salicylate hydroxylase